MLSYKKNMLEKQPTTPPKIMMAVIMTTITVLHQRLALHENGVGSEMMKGTRKMEPGSKENH